MLLYGRTGRLTAQNGGFRPRRTVWRIDSCACTEGAACLITGQPWLRLSKCSSTLGPQASEVRMKVLRVMRVEVALEIVTQPAPHDRCL